MTAYSIKCEPITLFEPSPAHVLRDESFRLLELRAHIRSGDDPRDELRTALDLARSLDWQYVKVPTWVAQAALEALHPVVQFCQ